MKPKLTVSLSHNEAIIWRWTEEINDKAMTRLSVEEYRKVVKAAEKELAVQVGKYNRSKEVKDEGRRPEIPE
jgi:hypothetical protein